MNRAELVKQIREKRSFLCVGLDPDLHKIPSHLLEFEDPIFEFNKAIIEATKDYCVAYKPNIAFYESLGVKGWQSLKKTIEIIPETHLAIADAKRGDIGNTSSMYAKAYFEDLGFDAITVAPYMGKDSVEPFLEYEDKWVVLLALTSNSGSADFQFLESNGKMLHEHVIETAIDWAGPDRLMFVCGATHPDDFTRLRKIAPEYFFLVPGIGAQGGDLTAIAENGMNSDCGLLANSSRGIIYANNGPAFAARAGDQAKKLAFEMSSLLSGVFA